jgi:hypothetical protein
VCTLFLELKQFTTGEVDLEQAIAHEFATCGFPDSTQSTRKLLKNGKLLILLDGLDEVPTQQLDEAKVIDRIRDFVDRYKQNRFIASCRTAAYQGSFKKFSDVTVADFDDKQIKQFIDNWFRAEKDIQAGTAQHCWDLLKTPNHSATKELAQTPLLLTLLCLIFSDTQNFPEKRAELYRQALNILLREWGVKRDPIYKDLSLKLETSMLGEIAYQSFASNRLFFLQQEVVDQIHDYLASKLNASCLNSEDVLQAIQVQQGILVERTKNILSFSHLTLQEYLCAQHIAEQSEVDNSFVTQLLSKYFTNRRWREVWQLLTGLMGEGSETLLLQMEQQAQTYLTDPGLSSLIDWADQETRNSEGSYKPSAKRTIAVYLAIALSRFDDHYYALANDEYYDRAIDISYNSGYYLNCTLGRTFALALALGFDTSCIVNFDFMFAPFESNGFDFGLQSKFTQEFRADCTLDFARVLERTKIFKAVAFPDLIFQLESLQKSDLSSYRFPERDFDSPLQDLWDFALEVSRVWHRAFHLKSAWDSSSNIENLYNYVYANELIIRCKEAAVRVSSQTWAGIEARMLTLKSLPSQDQDPIALPLSQNSTAQPQFKSSLSQPENVTMNFYGTVYGTAGNVQGDQNVNPTE